MLFRSMAALAVAVLVSSTASAGAIGSAELTLTDVRFLVLDSGSFRTATAGFGADAVANGNDFRLRNAGTSAEQEINFDGNYAYQGGSVDIDADGVLSTTGVGFGPASQFLGDMTPGSEDFIRTEMGFGGSFIDIDGLVGGSLTSPANGRTFADFNVNTPGMSGDADVTIANTSIARFLVAEDSVARIAFKATLDMSLFDDGNPFGFLTSASSGLTLSLTGVGPGYGIAAGNPLTAFTRTITVGPNQSASVSEFLDFESDDIFLAAGQTYTLTLSQSVGVAVSQIPEPSSLAIFGVMGIAGLAVGRRKLKKS